MSYEFERKILFACLRNALPSVQHYGDDLLASKIKNVDIVAKEFVILVQAELNQKYFDVPDNSQNLLVNYGTVCMKYIKQAIEEWSWKVTVKTICENVDLLQNKFADECPAMAECRIKLDYKTAHLVHLA
jgi:hypothetical protein